jgi:hypothetical protein
MDQQKVVVMSEYEEQSNISWKSLTLKVPPEQSVTGHVCVQVLQRLWNAAQRKQHNK